MSFAEEFYKGVEKNKQLEAYHKSMVDKFKQLKDPRPDILLDMIKKDGLLLELVENQTPDLCSAAVAQNWRALEFVDDQTPEICINAINQNSYAFELIKNQTPEICMTAVKDNGLLIADVRKQTKELCLAAVNQNGRALEHVRNRTPDINMAAVTNEGEAIQFIKKKTPELCMAAVTQNSLALLHIGETNQTPEVCMAAMKNPSTGDYRGMAYNAVKHKTEDLLRTSIHYNFNYDEDIINRALLDIRIAAQKSDYLPDQHMVISRIEQHLNGVNELSSVDDLTADINKLNKPLDLTLTDDDLKFVETLTDDLNNLL